MSNSDSPNGSPAPGFDARKELEKFGPPKPAPGPDITMGLPTDADLGRHDVAARHDDNTVDRSSYVPARILWPALGFPAVIAPNGNETAEPARRICLLIVCDRDPERRPLSKLDVAKHLRIVPWANRHKRWSKTKLNGSTEAFLEEHIDSPRQPELFDDGTIQESQFMKKLRKAANWLGFGSPPLTELWTFAGAVDPTLEAMDISDAENGVRVGLSKFVRKFYAERGLKYMYDVRLSQEASAAVGTGLFNLYWINPDPSHDETYRSAEMRFLLQEYAEPTWAAQPRKPSPDILVGKTKEIWSAKYKTILDEYEFGLRQKPNADTRTECLHPVFIQEAKPSLHIGHLTDLHFDTRWDAYEANLRKSGRPGAAKFYNWNRASEKNLRAAKSRCDVLLLTGDLIEYGRGYNEIGSLGEKSSYWRDRNWFYFYQVLASGTNYQKPTYTSLGNHDWRINPYPPFAPGAAGLDEMGYIDRDDLIAAHGVGHGANEDSKDGKDGASKDYDPLDGKAIGVGFWKMKAVRDGALDVKGTPIETTVDSVTWYLLLINPFLDYSCPLPGGYSLTMLDWAQRERVNFHVIAGGIDFGPTILLPNTHGGPMALDGITPHQWWLVQQVADFHIGPRILGIHAPLLGPWAHWLNDQLPTGRLKFTREDAYAPFRVQRLDETDQQYTERLRFARGADVRTQTTRDGTGHETTTRIYEYPTKAFRLSKDDAEGQEANYGAVVRHRAELIKLLRKSKFHLVFSGHIHRGNLLMIDVESMIDVPGKTQKQISDYHSEWLIKSVDEKAALTAPGPLFVNSTSCGPPGHNYASRGIYKRAKSGYTEVTLAKDGTLQLIETRTVAQPVVQELKPVIVR